MKLSAILFLLVGIVTIQSVQASGVSEVTSDHNTRRVRGMEGESSETPGFMASLTKEEVAAKTSSWSQEYLNNSEQYGVNDKRTKSAWANYIRYYDEFKRRP